MPGTLFVVATPIGNLEDISARALRILRQVQVIAAEDTRRTHHLLARYAIDTPTISLHRHNEARKLKTLVERLTRGDEVALVSDAGTPTISDPGQQLIRAAIDAGLRVEPIPGASAAMAALAASGIAADSFTFLGFPPIRSKDREKWFSDLSEAGRPVVFFEAPHRILETLGEISRRLGDAYVSVGRELTKAHEELVRGPISEVLRSITEPIGEFTVVIDIGHITDNKPVAPVADSDLALEFGLMANSGSGSKRKLINLLAKRHGRPPNEIYKAVERGRKLVK